MISKKVLWYILSCWSESWYLRSNSNCHKAHQDVKWDVRTIVWPRGSLFLQQTTNSCFGFTSCCHTTTTPDWLGKSALTYPAWGTPVMVRVSFLPFYFVSFLPPGECDKWLVLFVVDPLLSVVWPLEVGMITHQLVLHYYRGSGQRDNFKFSQYFTSIFWQRPDCSSQISDLLTTRTRPHSACWSWRRCWSWTQQREVS